MRKKQTRSVYKVTTYKKCRVCGKEVKARGLPGHLSKAHGVKEVIIVTHLSEPQVIASEEKQVIERVSRYVPSTAKINDNGECQCPYCLEWRVDNGWLKRFPDGTCTSCFHLHSGGHPFELYPAFMQAEPNIAKAIAEHKKRR